VVCRSKHVEPSINFGIINSITKLHLVGIFSKFKYQKLKLSEDPVVLGNDAALPSEPRCIGPGRARTQIPFNSIQFTQ